MAKPRKANGLRAVAVSVNQVVRPMCRKRGLADAGLINDWPHIVGKELAGQCQPQRLVRKRGADGGTLHILVAGPLALELQHLAPQVMERINGYFGYRAVDRLTLHQGPINRRAVRPKPARPEPPVPPDLAAQAEAIEDPDLKRALLGFGRQVLASRG